MIFCRFRKSGLVSLGIVEGDGVRAIEGLTFDKYTLASSRHRLDRRNAQRA